jgi:RNA polymerase-binding transcription factor DksA
MSDTSRPATVATGHLVLTEELRDQIRERLLGMLDSTSRRLERNEGEKRTGAIELIDAIEAIRGALVKLDAGYYGVCEMCEEPIPFERLDAIPSVRHCVACQTRRQPLVG